MSLNWDLTTVGSDNKGITLCSRPNTSVGPISDWTDIPENLIEN